MTLKNFKDTLFSSLSHLYPKTEIDTFFFLLIEEYLNHSRIDFVLNTSTIINEENQKKLQNALKRLEKEEPIQYILGHTEFYGYPFYVDKNTLIPRPETEELVEWILKEVKNLATTNQRELQILDVGTGSGCIIISLAKNLTNCHYSAIDVSNKTLEVAKKNTVLNNVTIEFIELDILKAEKLVNSFDIIISNPPYVRDLEKIEIKNNVLQNEPHKALFVPDDNPLLFYDKIADLAKNHLTKNGLLFFEINQYLHKETESLLLQKGFKNITTRKDLFGNFRMTKANL